MMTLVTLVTLAARSRSESRRVHKPMSSRMLRIENWFVMTLVTLMTLLFLDSREGAVGAGGSDQKLMPGARPLELHDGRLEGQEAEGIGRRHCKMQIAGGLPLIQHHFFVAFRVFWCHAGWRFVRRPTTWRLSG